MRSFTATTAATGTTESIGLAFAVPLPSAAAECRLGTDTTAHVRELPTSAYRTSHPHLSSPPLSTSLRSQSHPYTLDPTEHQEPMWKRLRPAPSCCP